LLEFISYEKETEIQDFSLKTLKNKKVTVICPHPTLADNSRLIFDSDFKILTISRFIKDQLALAFPESQIVPKTKADLLLFLSGVWRQKIGPEKLETFKQAFKLFTELRSFTLDLNLIEEILPEFGEEVATALRLFWAVCEQLELIDEHKTYALLSQAHYSLENPLNLKTQKNDEEECFIFWGFRHLSSLQVDYIKALSHHYDIYIPLPKAVLSLIKNSDWPSWLGAKVQERALKKDNETQEIFQIKMIPFSKGRLSEKMLSFFQRPDAGPALNGDVLLCTESPELDHYLEIPLQNLNYRSSLELWKGDFEKVCELLSQREGAYEVTLNKLIEEGLRAKKFSRLKILLLFKNIFIEWKNLSSFHDEPRYFDEMVIREISLLRLPRNFIFPLLKEDQGSIHSLREIESLRRGHPLYVCASSKYEDLKGGSEAYNTRVMEFLRAIGPIQRREFSFLFIKNNLHHLFKREDCFLFFEEGLLDHMLGWSDLLSETEFQVLAVPSEQNRDKINDPLSVAKKIKYLETISATNIQAYIDCPRKFYYTHLERLKERPEFESSLRSDELGSLEHEVIEKYFLTYENWDFVSHQKIVKKQIENYLLQKEKKLSFLEAEKSFWEISNFSSNGIKALLKLKQVFPQSSFSFESKLQGHVGHLPIRGRVDCIMQSAQGWGLLDFKRSKASIPTQSEIEAFESVQLPFYLSHLHHNNEVCLFCGHLNLSEINESQIFAKDENTLMTLRQLDFLEGKKLVQFFPDLSAFCKKEENILKAILHDETYLANPLNKDVCTFCNLLNICTRGVSLL